MAEGDEISASEFSALRRLLADGQARVDDTELQALVGKRFVRRGDNAWVVTVQGHAAFLHELRRSFDRPANET